MKVLLMIAVLVGVAAATSSLSELLRTLDQELNKEKRGTLTSDDIAARQLVEVYRRNQKCRKCEDNQGKDNDNSVDICKGVTKGDSMCTSTNKDLCGGSCQACTAQQIEDCGTKRNGMKRGNEDDEKLGQQLLGAMKAITGLQ